MAGREPRGPLVCLASGHGDSILTLMPPRADSTRVPWAGEAAWALRSLGVPPRPGLWQLQGEVTLLPVHVLFLGETGGQA